VTATLRGIAPELVWTGSDFTSGKVVLVDGDTIARVCDATDVPDGTMVEDWAGLAVVPGTVNAHGHAFQSLLKGFADDRPFESWRDDVLYPFSERLDGEGIYAGALFAFAEALLAGVTTIVDFFYLNDSGNENATQVIRAARETGIRLVLARAFYDVDAPTAAPVRYREPPGAAADRTRALAADHAGNPDVSIQPAPHSLHAASPDTIAAALEVARDLGVPCHLHLAEAAYEPELVRKRYGLTPIRLLAREGLLDERLVGIHVVWADDEELDMLAAARCAVVHCPGANAFLGDGMARVPEMLSRGVRVALGPDGGCANNRQSVFDEMRMATLVAKARLTDGAALDAPTAFRLGTAGGADALGLPVGELAPRRRADLVGLDMTDLSLQPLATLSRQLVASMQPTAIARVMVGGRVVAADGRLLLTDQDRIRALVADVTSGWTRP
jgi:5-methylthioadenosine/S-adenosylhomocysteine deaminase